MIYLEQTHLVTAGKKYWLAIQEGTTRIASQGHNLSIKVLYLLFDFVKSLSVYIKQIDHKVQSSRICQIH